MSNEDKAFAEFEEFLEAVIWWLCVALVSAAFISIAVVVFMLMSL